MIEDEVTQRRRSSFFFFPPSPYTGSFMRTQLLCTCVFFQQRVQQINDTRAGIERTRETDRCADDGLTGSDKEIETLVNLASSLLFLSLLHPHTHAQTYQACTLDEPDCLWTSASDPFQSVSPSINHDAFPLSVSFFFHSHFRL